MENGKGKSNGDLYAVLGLNSRCSQADLRHAYKKLAMKWHPDRCSASGNPAFAEEAKRNFQSIQHAYSVLSNTNKRLMYDIGAYDSDGDDIGMDEFLDEMVAMMDQTKPKGDESMEEFQELFDELFHDDVQLKGSSSSSVQPENSFSFFHGAGRQGSIRIKRSLGLVEKVLVRLQLNF